MIAWPSPESIDASDHQREQYASIANSGSRIAVLEGGGGTGKTYTASQIIKAVVASGIRSIGMCAPTGKAAIRLTQLMRQNNVPIGHEATTIHRMLGVTRSGHDGTGWGFYFNAGNPLPHEMILVDESSMVGTDLGASLFSAIRPDSLVLVIGDTGQLLPVGHGAPMRDMLAAGIPSARLTEVRRNAGDLALACKAMRETGQFSPSRGKRIDTGQNWWHFDSRSPKRTRDIIKSLLSNLPGDVTINDVQVLATVNAKSPLSRQPMNELLAPIVNPKHAKKPSSQWFAADDKVMCLQNGYYKAIDDSAESVKSILGQLNGGGSTDGILDDITAQLERTGQSEAGETENHFVANGEIGFVKECTPGTCTVEFDSPKRIVEFAGEQMKQLTLAAAITVHKSQGSSWPIVIFPIDDHASSRYLASRELVYTALTRMERLVITVGQAGVAKKMLSKVAIQNRKTFLSEDLNR